MVDGIVQLAVSKSKIKNTILGYAQYAPLTWVNPCYVIHIYLTFYDMLILNALAFKNYKNKKVLKNNQPF